MTEISIRLDDLAAAQPWLLGYHPDEQTVGIVLGPDGNTGAVLAFPPDTTPEAAAASLGLAAANLDPERGSSTVLIANGAHLDRSAAAARTRAIADMLHPWGIPAVASIGVQDGRIWWSTEPGSPALPVDPLTAVNTGIAEHMPIPARSRDDLTSALNPRIGPARDALADALPGTAALLASAAAPDPAGWRTHTAELLADRLTAPAPLTPREAAAAALCLSDIHIRDMILIDIAQRPQTEGRAAFRTAHLADLATTAPPELAAPPATILAAERYMAGGAGTRPALEAALANDPDYNLAKLMETMLTLALPPERWRTTTRAAAGFDPSPQLPAFATRTSWDDPLVHDPAAQGPSTDPGDRDEPPAPDAWDDLAAAALATWDTPHPAPGPLDVDLLATDPLSADPLGGGAQQRANEGPGTGRSR